MKLSSCATPLEYLLHMAIKPTIYKINTDLSDLNREVYQSFSLTLARHPSETAERMLVRLLVYCLNYHEHLELCKGLSDSDEPDLWQKALSGVIEQWIEVGEPSADRIKKATRQSQNARVYCFNSKADTWWQLELPKLGNVRVTVMQFPWLEIQKLASMIDRTMDISVTISADSLFVATGQGQVELSLRTLQEANS